MNHHYEDIRSRIAESPKWWDEEAVPRYCDFAPSEVANIYARVVALVEIACQECGTRFNVAMSEGPFAGSHPLPARSRSAERYRTDGLAREAIRRLRESGSHLGGGREVQRARHASGSHRRCYASHRSTPGACAVSETTVMMRCVYCFRSFVWRFDRVLAQCDECMAKEHDAWMRKLTRHSFARRLYHRVRLLFISRRPSHD